MNNPVRVPYHYDTFSGHRHRMPGARLRLPQLAFLPKIAPRSPTPKLAAPFYSRLERAIEAKMPARASQDQIEDIAEGPDTSSDEFRFSGLPEWLERQSEPIAREDVLRFLREHQVDLTDKWLRGGDSRYGEHVLPGGRDYREVLMTLPDTGVGTFQSSHWPDSPNVLVHARVDDRTDSHGHRLLFIEELQSDWHQRGRRYGYQGDSEHSQAVPPAPFSKTWHEWALRKLLRVAAEDGYDGIAWTTGEQQAARYDLSPHIDEIRYHVRPDDTVALSALKDGDTLYRTSGANRHDLDDLVGKEIAERILGAEPPVGHTRKERSGVLAGADLRSGGTGLATFYDGIIPRYLDRYGRPWGAEPTTVHVDAGGAEATIHSFMIPDAMRDSILYEGQPMFKSFDGSETNGLTKAIPYPTLSIPHPLPSGPAITGAVAQVVQRKDGHSQRYWTKPDIGAGGSTTPSVGAISLPRNAAYTSLIPTAPQGADTQQHFRRDDGSYHPQRAQLHEHIINHFLDRAGDKSELHAKYGDFVKQDAQKHAVFLAGGSGSGKSFYKTRKYGSHPRFVHIDADAIKEHLPEYDAKAPHLVHEESSDIAKELHRRTMAAGHSFVYDGTGASVDSMKKKFDQSRQHGYAVHARRVHVPLEVAALQNAQRARKVPDEVFQAIHRGVDEAWPHIARMADTSKVIDNRRAEKESAISERRRERQQELEREGRLKPVGPNGLRKAMNNPSPILRNARIHWGDGHHMRGIVQGDKFHVTDIVHDGVSERDLTGQKPEMHPMPLQTIQERGGELEWLDGD